MYFFSDARLHHVIRNRSHLLLLTIRRVHISMFVLSLSIRQSSLFLSLFRIICGVAGILRENYFRRNPHRQDTPKITRSIKMCLLFRESSISSLQSRVEFYYACEDYCFLLLHMTLVARRTQIVYYFIPLAYCFLNYVQRETSQTWMCFLRYKIIKKLSYFVFSFFFKQNPTQHEKNHNRQILQFILTRKTYINKIFIACLPIFWSTCIDIMQALHLTKSR